MEGDDHHLHPVAVFAVGLLLPPVGWAVTHLMALWFAGVGSRLWLRR